MGLSASCCSSHRPAAHDNNKHFLEPAAAALTKQSRFENLPQTETSADCEESWSIHTSPWVLVPALLAVIIMQSSISTAAFLRFCVAAALVAAVFVGRQSRDVPEQASAKAYSEAPDIAAHKVPEKIEGIVSMEEWSTPRDDTWQLPIECRPLTGEQASLYFQIRSAVAGKTYAELARDESRAVWLTPPDKHAPRADEQVDFADREVLRIAQAICACKAADPVLTGVRWLQQHYALRFDHGMDLPEMRLDITAEQVQRCRQIYPKAMYGLAKPHGYPIFWDMVSALRLKAMTTHFGSPEAALERILWYDLHVLELCDRYRKRLSKERGGVLFLKSIWIVDLGAWSTDLLHRGILRTCQQIIARSGAVWPESLWRIYLVNVPWMFKAPWSVIKAYCHPVTLEKLRFFWDKQEFLDHMETEHGIGRDGIPQENGGTGPRLVDIPFTPTADLDFNMS